MPRSYHSSSHMPDHCQSLTAAPGLECSETGEDDEDTALTLERIMTNTIELRPISNSNDTARRSEVSELPTMLPGMEALEVEHERGKLRKPKTLFKQFSTDGLRNWFH